MSENRKSVYMKEKIFYGEHKAEMGKILQDSWDSSKEKSSIPFIHGKHGNPRYKWEPEFPVPIISEYSWEGHKENIVHSKST